MTNSRAAFAALLLPLSLAALTGCSGDDDDADDTSPVTTACRTYLLESAGQDTEAARMLSGAARSGTYSPDALRASLETVATAARDAGLVEGLPDDDFERYNKVAQATGVAYGRANPNGGAGITTPIYDVFQAAADAARTACTSDD